MAMESLAHQPTARAGGGGVGIAVGILVMKVGASPLRARMACVLGKEKMICRVYLCRAARITINVKVPYRALNRQIFDQSASIVGHGLTRHWRTRCNKGLAFFRCFRTDAAQNVPSAK